MASKSFMAEHLMTHLSKQKNLNCLIAYTSWQTETQELR